MNTIAVASRVDRWMPQPLQCRGGAVDPPAAPEWRRFGPFLAVTTARAGMRFVSALGFRFALGR